MSMTTEVSLLEEATESGTGDGDKAVFDDDDFLVQIFFDVRLLSAVGDERFITPLKRGKTCDRKD